MNGETVDLDAPGFELQERKNGARDQYWVATCRANARLPAVDGEAAFMILPVRLAGMTSRSAAEHSPTKCWRGLLILPTRASPYTTAHSAH